ncbi:MAG TPA: AAA family ATPase [Candidatus Tumulicola sp.]|jgi:DNA-binding CsgD family transcriptional regulator
MIAPRISSRRIVGRDLELQLLHEARRALSSRHGSFVLVGGEAGIGKTRLLAEFTATLRGGRAPLRAAGEALEDAPRPFGPFRSVLETLVAASPSVIGAAQPIVHRALGALVPDALTAAGFAVPMSARVEKAELFTGVTRFIEAVAEKRAIVVVLEDLHWADSATLELLCHLAPRIGTTRLLLVGTYRDDDIRPEHRLFAPLARLLREHTVRSVRLEPLADHDVRALIEDALDGAFALSPDRLRDVVAGCDGNPFFIEEMLKHAVEIERGGLAAPMPISIRGLTLQRVAHLNVSDRQVLDYAAVLGQRFAATTLAAATGQASDRVMQALQRLQDLGVLLEDSAPKHLHFRHALVRQIVYGELPTETVRSMHASIVELLELESQPDVDALAYHAWRADLRERTLEYSECAGDAALGVRAAAQAATYFERALEVATDDDMRIRLFGKSGEAWLQQSDFGRAVPAFLAQHDLLLDRHDYSGASAALTRAAAEEANGGHIREALARLIAYDATYGADLPREAADRVNANLARIATAGDNFDLATRALEKIRDPQQLDAFTHQVYWLAQLFTSEHALDVPGWRRAADALERRNPETYPLMRSQMLHSIASTSILLAESDAGGRAVDAAIAIDNEFGLFRALAFANAVKACILGARGRLAAARSCIDAALEQSGLFVVRIELAIGASAVALALGQDALAQRLLEKEFETALEEAGMGPAISAFRGMRALLLFSLGRKAEASALLDESLAAEQHPFAVVHFWPLASQHATPSQQSKLLEHCTVAAARPGASIAQACLALLSGDGVAAAERYRELGWPIHEALSLERSGDGNAALEIFRRCGSARDVRRLELHSAPSTAVRTAKGQLSTRELEVANLIARGLTNRRIAEQLGVREKTIEKYVTSIYAKLAFTTRAQLAAHVTRQNES